MWLNEGLEVLGTDDSSDENKVNGIVFADSAIESVRIPSTLRVIEENAFNKCRGLRSVEFSEGLEEIRSFAFAETGVERVVFPASLRVIAQKAFAMCEHLKEAIFQEGIEALGTHEDDIGS